MKKTVAVLFAFLLLFAAGCKVDYDITINSDLSGTCVAKVLTAGFIPKETFEEKLQERGLKNYTITEYTETVDMAGRLSVPVSGLKITTFWKDPDEVGHILRKNADGTVNVALDYMAGGGGKAIVRVEGRIDPESTRGRIMDSNTVEFESGQKIYFRFKPESSLIDRSIMMAVIAGLILLIAIVIMAVRKKSVASAGQSSSPAANSTATVPETTSASAPAQAPSCSGTADIAKKKTFCAECGTEAREGDNFCAKCGNKLV